MASERLSKLQKWILETCFKITVLHDRNGLKPLKICCYYDEKKCSESVIKERDCYNNIEYHCNVENKRSYKNRCKMYDMYTEDILLNYFGMECSSVRDVLYRVARIEMNENTNKNYATISRTLKNMEYKGLVYRWKFEEYSTEIHLTDKGKEIARVLLNVTVDEIEEPPLLSDEECEREQKKLEAQIQRLEAHYS